MFTPIDRLTITSGRELTTWGRGSTICLLLVAMAVSATAQTATVAFNDHQNMMDQWGLAHGDAKWVDAHGSFLAGILAGPDYRLLGKTDFGTPGDYLADPMPPVNQLVGGELAWRQHDGGHDVTPNWPAFLKCVSNYIEAPPRPASSEIP